VFVADAFETPTAQGSVGQAARPGCKPADCDCFDLGEIEVEFEEPRLCELTVESLASGINIVGGDGPLAAGDAVVGASVRGTLAGGVQIPQAGIAAVCNGADCGPSLVPDSGTTTFAVPVVGDAPQIQLDASWSVKDGDTLHYYTASLVIPGCTREQTALTDPSSLSLDHAEVAGLADFISSIKDVVKPPLGNDTGGSNPKSGALGGCACQVVGGTAANGPAGLAVLGLLLGAALGRRRRQA